MTTKVKTTATFIYTFTFESSTEHEAIRTLSSWFRENSDSFQLTKDSDTGEYTYTGNECDIRKTFKFKTPDEFITKFYKVNDSYAPVRSMLDYASHAGVTATVETIEVKEDK